MDPACQCIQGRPSVFGAFFVQQGERVSEMIAISFLVFIVRHIKETGNTTQRVFLCMSVCIYVCARTCGQHVANTPGEPS